MQADQPKRCVATGTFQDRTYASDRHPDDAHDTLPTAHSGGRAHDQEADGPPVHDDTTPAPPAQSGNVPLLLPGT